MESNLPNSHPGQSLPGTAKTPKQSAQPRTGAYYVTAKDWQVAVRVCRRHWQFLRSGFADRLLTPPCRLSGRSFQRYALSPASSS
jgi:hypothetical protein